jgi:hypothetical protein
MKRDGLIRQSILGIALGRISEYSSRYDKRTTDGRGFDS